MSDIEARIKEYRAKIEELETAKAFYYDKWLNARENIGDMNQENATLRAQVAQLTLELTGCRDLIARIAEAHRPHCTTECIEGVWWAKCKSGGVYGPHSTEREALLEVAEREQEIARLREGVRAIVHKLSHTDYYSINPAAFCNELASLPTEASDGK